MRKYLFILVLFFGACVSDGDYDNTVAVTVLHMEELYEGDPDTLKLEYMAEKYGYFWEVYRQHIVSLPNDASFADSLRAFQQNEHYQEAYQALKKKYADYEAVELKQAMQRYHHHFPERLVPRVVTFYGGFNYPVVATDSVLGIGLEMFLGKESQFYEALAQKYPRYMHQQFQQDYLPALSMKGWLETEFPLPHQNFLAQMIHQGRVQYVLSELLPNTADSVLMGYSQQQMDWCKASEAAIWRFIIEEDLLYNADQMLIAKYLNPAPFTRGMPQESPGRVVAWVGWQIVKAYMERNPSMSINDLMRISDAQYLLNESKYKP